MIMKLFLKDGHCNDLLVKLRKLEWNNNSIVYLLARDGLDVLDEVIGELASAHQMTHVDDRNTTGINHRNAVDEGVLGLGAVSLETGGAGGGEFFGDLGDEILEGVEIVHLHEGAGGAATAGGAAFAGLHTGDDGEFAELAVEAGDGIVRDGEDDFSLGGGVLRNHGLKLVDDTCDHAGFSAEDEASLGGT